MTVEPGSREGTGPGGSTPLRVLVVGLEPALIATLEATLDSVRPQLTVAVSSITDSAGARPDGTAVTVVGTGGARIDGPAVADLLGHLPDVPVVIVSDLDDDAAVFAALGHGVRGYLLAGINGDELAGALQRVALGETVLDMGVGGRIASGIARGVVAGPPVPETFDLRPRERQVLEALLGGRTNREIAEMLSISEETVKSHLRTIYRRLGVTSRTEAIVRALRRRPP